MRRGRRAGHRGSESLGSVWGVKCPRRSGARKAQAQRVGWQQHQVAAVFATASCNRCRQVGASRGGWRGSLNLDLLSYLCQGLERGGSGKRSRHKAGPSSPGVPALATQQVGEGQRGTCLKVSLRQEQRAPGFQPKLHHIHGQVICYRLVCPSISKIGVTELPLI